MSKPYDYRDGPLVDGIASRQTYQMAEISDIPAAEICDGLLTASTNPTGWWQTWSPIVQANQGTQTYIDWSREHQAITSPDCISDLSFTYNVGNWYIRNRRNRIYMWIDWRLLINGTVVLTRSNQIYRYLDSQTDTSPDVINPIPVNVEPLGMFTGSRLNIPANASVEVETRVRWNVNGSQTSSWARVIGGIRSSVQYSFTPKQIVTDLL